MAEINIGGQIHYGFEFFGTVARREPNSRGDWSTTGLAVELDLVRSSKTAFGGYVIAFDAGLLTVETAVGVTDDLAAGQQVHGAYEIRDQQVTILGWEGR